jgi:hypothetical protein
MSEEANYKVEYAKTGRAKCSNKTKASPCLDQKICKGELRIGVEMETSFFSGEDAMATKWYHPGMRESQCYLRRLPSHPSSLFFLLCVDCFFKMLKRSKKLPELTDSGDLEGYLSLTQDDQEWMDRMVAGDDSPTSSPKARKTQTPQNDNSTKCAYGLTCYRQADRDLIRVSRCTNL